MLISSFSSVNKAARNFFPSSNGQSSLLISIAYKSFHASTLSFLLSLSFINVKVMLSHTLFSICITSKLCHNKLNSQYESWKNMFFFFHCCVWYVVVFFPQFLFHLSNDFGFFPNVMLILLTCSKISKLNNCFGGSLSSMFPLNWTWFNQNLCLLDINGWYPIKHHLLLNGRWSIVTSKLQDGQAKLV